MPASTGPAVRRVGPVACRAAASLAAALSLLAGLTGCAGLHPRPCISWVDYATSAEREEAATIVVVSDSVEARGTEQRYGVDAAAYDVVVAEVVKGEVAVGSELRVVSTPDPCGSDSYPEGDPMEAPGPLRLSLTAADDGTYSTLTPYDGVESASASE